MPSKVARTKYCPILSVGSFVVLKQSNSNPTCIVKVEKVTRNTKQLSGVIFAHPKNDANLKKLYLEGTIQPQQNEVVQMDGFRAVSVGLSQIERIVFVSFISVCDVPEKADDNYYCRFRYQTGKLIEIIQLQPLTPKLAKSHLFKFDETNALRNGKCVEGASPAKKAKNNLGNDFNEEWVEKNESSDSAEFDDPGSSTSGDSIINLDSESGEENKPTKSLKKITTKTTEKNQNRRSKLNCKLNYKRTVTDIISQRDPLSAELDRICNLSNGFDRALAMLHVSSVPLELPCREMEFGNVFSFVHDHLASGTSGCMYVSGTPGTGKTATVLEVISYLGDLSKQKEVPTFKFISVNGMKLTSPQQVYSEIWLQLKGVHLGVESAVCALEQTFLKESAVKREHVVMLVDELDLLLTSKQDILYNLFEWPSSKVKSKLIVLCIANTMDLPERVMMKRVSSRLGLTRVVFQPYNHSQLKQIIQSRVQSSGVFSDTAVEFAARKMSALSGDARRSLDICRRATEIAQSKGCNSVGIAHITDAFNEMFRSKKMSAMSKCSTQEKLLLKSIVSEFRRCGLEEAWLHNVYTQYRTLCNLEGQVVLPPSVMLRLVANLDATKLIMFQGCARGMDQKIILNSSVDDVNFAMAKE